MPCSSRKSGNKVKVEIQLCSVRGKFLGNRCTCIDSGKEFLETVEYHDMSDWLQRYTGICHFISRPKEIIPVSGVIDGSHTDTRRKAMV